MLRQMFSRAFARQAVPSIAEVIDESACPQATVLVVEDDQVNSAALVQLLKGQGYRAEAIGDGERALASIDRAAPDLVLLDVQLPGMSGYDVCRCIKQKPATRLIPVVLVTGLDA